MRRTQQGTSYIGILLVIIAAAFMVKVLVAIWSPYWDNHVINTQIEELMVIAPNNTSPAQFKTDLVRRLTINNIHNVKADDFVRVSNADGLHVQTNYEVRKPFLLNIDLVLKFEKSFDKNSIKN
ncbi:DUF4845 domain-containing protein [uncultured Acinetobacter sp.]|uniref:DUF4845 domain-containing protein n=1 Tax=uncultured Acinetobacter sp. TaxID=165433 RepID=UPI00261A7994|nr:DUF4845 domain-containing protein [uncultured Acinetobacter sp.]